MASSVPTISSGALKKLLVTASELGIPSEALCAATGFDASVCDDADARVPLPMLHALWEAVIAGCPRPDVALQPATRFQPGDYGLVGFVCMNCANLGDTLRLVTRYLRLWTDDPALELREDGRMEVIYRTPFPDRPGLRCTAESTLAELLHSVRLVTQQNLIPLEVCFTHPGPEDTSGHDAFFGVQVRFGQPTIHLRFSHEQLATALPRADEQLGMFLRGLANDALARKAPATTSLLEQARRAVAEALPHEIPSLPELAKRMAVSERTLRRRLHEEGTTFRALLDETRSHLARSYVGDRRLPIAEVAFLLGFSEPSAFHRAFRRWTGMTPASYRQGRA
ncbi:MAG: AraC family transcriptional regulator [Deltaproteobacteria bacterium]|nr:AraC family transcriptional regulator [Deltaproteobacteria bacterium]